MTNARKTLTLINEINTRNTAQYDMVAGALCISFTHTASDQRNMRKGLFHRVHGTTPIVRECADTRAFDRVR